MKRILSIALALCMMLGCAALLGGCNGEKGDNWPVTVGNVTIDKEPQNIVVLSDKLADIVSYIGYDVKMVGRSTECDQDFLYIVPTMGTAAAPDINAIVAAETDLVITDSATDASAAASLETSGIKVLSLENAQNEEQLKALYTDLGTALGGRTTGAKKGEKAYGELFDTLKTFSSAAKTDTLQPAVYLYLDEQGQLCTFTKGTLQHKFFGYCGGTNVLVNQNTPVVDESELHLFNPAYIFYDSAEVLSYLSANPSLATLAGLQKDQTLLIPKKNFERYGTGLEKTVYQMLSFIETLSKATKDEAPTAPAETVQPTQAATQAATVASTEEPTEEIYDEEVYDEEVYE
ncbi:MAG: ABC transporter substrate-binding protein [Ruminococcus sp.]|nr:ABC transporter substrate-binding protein [Ruminococcus sp.]